MSAWVCCHDRRALRAEGHLLICDACGATTPTREGIALFATDAGSLARLQRSIAPLEEFWRLIEAHGAAAATANLAQIHNLSHSVLSSDWRFFLPLPRGGRALQLGAGVGAESAELVAWAGELVALVPSQLHARILSARLPPREHPNLRIGVLAELGRLPLADRSADVIVMEQAGATGFGLSADNLGAAAAEWRRVLVPGGTLVVTTANPLWRFGGLRLLSRPLRAPRRRRSLNRWVQSAGAARIRRPFSGARLRRELRRQGFGAPEVYAPLPDQERAVAVVPIEDRRAVLYFLDNLVRRSAWPAQVAIAAAKLLTVGGLVSRLVPDTILRFRLAAPDGG